MAQMVLDSYAEAQCGCILLPCGRRITLRPLHEFKRHHFGTDHSSTESDSKPYNPADAPHRPYSTFNESSDNDASSGGLVERSTRYPKEGTSSGDSPCNRAVLQRTGQSGLGDILDNELGYPPTERDIDNFPSRMDHRPLVRRPRR